MRQHPKRKKCRTSHRSLRRPCAQRKAKPPVAKAPWACLPKADGAGGFLSLLLERIGWEELNGLNQRRHGAGRPVQRLTRGQLLAGILFHFTVSFAGTLGEHGFWLFGIQMAESTLSERRQPCPLKSSKSCGGAGFDRLKRPRLKPFIWACVWWPSMG